MVNLPDFEANAIITGDGYEWFYELKQRMVVRVALGAAVMAYEGTEDDRSRIIVETKSGYMIHVSKDRIFFLKEH
jgi:hypothetical protein